MGHGCTEIAVGRLRRNREFVLGFFGDSMSDPNCVTDRCVTLLLGSSDECSLLLPLPSNTRLCHLGPHWPSCLSPPTYKLRPTRFIQHASVDDFVEGDWVAPMGSRMRG